MTNSTIRVWTFKGETPPEIIEEVASFLSESEAAIFKSVLTCLVSDKMQSLYSKVEAYLE